MRFLKIVITGVILCCSIYVLAQTPCTTATIKGRVFIASKHPAENITVTLQLAKDSSVVKIVLTDKEGSYTFEQVKPGNYQIAFSGIGFKTVYSNSIAVFDTSIEMPHTLLEAETKQLQEVVVTANKPMIETKKGKIIVNVDASLTNAGTTALELLEKAPGVSVGNQGQINLKGRPGVLIMIDGKPSYLQPNDLTTLLSNMSSSSIDQIEIIANPPAKYDAAGNAGIINIKTKKNTTQGANANVSTSYIQGVYAKTTNSINLNYRNSNINIFGNYNYNHWESFNHFDLDRNFYDSTKTMIIGSYHQASYTRFSSNTHRAKIGLDYSINKKNMIGIILTGNVINEYSPLTNTANIKNKSDSLISKLKSTKTNDDIDQNLTANINYKGVLDTSGTELNIDLDYAHYPIKNKQQLQTIAFDTNNNIVGTPLVLNGQYFSFIRIYAAKADITHTFKNGIKLEAGFKTSWVKSNNILDYLRQQGVTWIKDSRSNHFIYNENIYATYINTSKEWKKWNLQLGLRLENTQSKGKQITIDTTFIRKYTNLFPNASVEYHINDKNNISLSYSRRINRPDYKDLNPFISFVDSLTYAQGNPNLKPEFNHTIELTHVYDEKITTTLNYSKTTDVITGLLKQNSNNKTTTETTDNLSTLTNIGLAINVSIPIQKWWATNTFINVFNNHYKGIYQSDPIDISVTSFAVNMTNTFIIQKGLTAELSGFYNSKTPDGLFITNPIYMVNAGLSTTILKNNGSLKLAVRDIFYSRKFNGYVRYSNIDDHFYNRGDSRTVNVTFTYRLGKKNIAKSRQRETGTVEEEKRIKQE